jgi:hypothetical protein
MKNELISMVDFVLGRENWLDVYYYGEGVIILNYANFLNTPLNISMFVPAIKVGDKWEVLEMPLSESVVVDTVGSDRLNDRAKPYWDAWIHSVKQYQTAKDNLLFRECILREFSDGISIDINGVLIKLVNIKTIQDLIKYKPTLTKKGLEVSGLNR